MANVSRDDNYVTTMAGVSYTDLDTPELLAVDPVNNRLLVTAMITSVTNYGITERYDYSSSPIYVGQAAVGISEGAASGWTITEYDLASSSAASGKIATDVSWTNRASGTFA